MSRNKSYQKSKNNNPALTRIGIENRIREAMDDAKNQGIRYASIIYNILLVMVLSDKTRLTDEEVQKVSDELTRVSESILGDYMTIPDAIKTLKEEYGFKLSGDDLLKYFPELEGYLDPDEDK